MREIRALLDDLPPDEVAVYQDEVDIHLDPKLGLDWMNRGQQKEVVTPGRNRKRYLPGAMNAKGGLLSGAELMRNVRRFIPERSLRRSLKIRKVAA